MLKVVCNSVHFRVDSLHVYLSLKSHKVLTLYHLLHLLIFFLNDVAVVYAFLCIIILKFELGS